MSTAILNKPVATKRPKILAILRDEQQHNDLKKLADARGRSVSNLVMWLVEEAIEQAKTSGELFKDD